MAEKIARLLTEKNVAKLVCAGLVLLGLMHYSTWWFAAFVDWAHVMGALWNKL